MTPDSPLARPVTRLWSPRPGIRKRETRSSPDRCNLHDGTPFQVNNAGVAAPDSACCRVNYFGTRDLTLSLWPLLARHGTTPRRGPKSPLVLTAARSSTRPSTNALGSTCSHMCIASRTCACTHALGSVQLCVGRFACRHWPTRVNRQRSYSVSSSVTGGRVVNVSSLVGQLAPSQVEILTPPTHTHPMRTLSHTRTVATFPRLHGSSAGLLQWFSSACIGGWSRRPRRPRRPSCR